MKLERVLVVLVFLILAAGLIVWARGGTPQIRQGGVWLMLGAFGVLCLPLLLLLVNSLLSRVRRKRE